MLDNLKTYRLVLASNSPRRRELLAGLGIDFTVRTMENLDESFPEQQDVSQVAAYIASQKAAAYRANMAPDELILTADTVVSIGSVILGKPVDRDDALRMLRLLSGKKHRVYTGVCLTGIEFQQVFTATTTVTFSVLTEEEMAYYVDTFNPIDKAGSYGVQEWIGYVAVEHMEGSYYNVMGLPVHQLYLALSNLPPLTN